MVLVAVISVRVKELGWCLYPLLPTITRMQGTMFARQGKGGSWCSYNDNHNRLVGTCSMPDCRRINSDGVDGSKHLLPISITGSGNGETSPWGWSPRTVEISFEQPHIPFWEVGHQRCNNLPFPGKGWIHSDWPLALCATAQTDIFLANIPSGSYRSDGGMTPS